MDIFINFGILVPVGARCCSFHLSGNFIKSSTYVHKSILKKKSISMNSNEIMKLFDDIRTAANHNRRLCLKMTRTNRGRLHIAFRMVKRSI